MITSAGETTSIVVVNNCNDKQLKRLVPTK